MRTASMLFVAATLLVLGAFVASGADQARPFVPRVNTDIRTPRQSLIWCDDLETGAPGWTHGDDSGQQTKFHIDTYLAYNDSVQDPDYSWWCGELNSEFAGGSGYGNLWNQWLELPPIELGNVSATAATWGSIKAMYRESARPTGSEAPSRSVAPVLTFRYMYDCEIGYDYVWVEAESLGEWVARER